MRKEFFSKAKNRITAVILAALLAVNVSAAAGTAKVGAAGVSDSDAPAVVKTVDDDKTEEVIEAAAEKETEEETAEETEEDFVDEAAAAEDTAETEKNEAVKDVVVSSADSGDASEAIDGILSGNIIGASETISDSDFMPVPVIMSRSDMLLGATPAPDDIASGTLSSTVSWIIDKDGNLTIYPTDGVSGTFGTLSSGSYRNDRVYVTTVFVEPGVKQTGNGNYTFAAMGNCTSMDLHNLDVSGLTDFSQYFCLDSKLAKLNIDGWNTENATTMGEMFYKVSSLQELDVSHFKTSKVTKFNSMFSGCDSVTELDVSKFDTSSAVDMHNMFEGCDLIETLDVSGFDTSNVTDMSGMFGFMPNLKTLDVSNFKTSKVEDMSKMFSNCPSLTELAVDKWDTGNCKSFNTTFWGCGKLKKLDVSNFDTKNATDFYYMFNGCSSLEKIDVSKWDTSNAKNIEGMFKYCRSITELDVSKWDVSNVTAMTELFGLCNKLTYIDVSSFNTAKATKMKNIFTDDNKITKYEVSAKWKPASNYSLDSYINCFNVVDGELQYQPYGNYFVKSVTIHDGGNDIEVDLEKNPTGWSGFTGDMTATIVFSIPLTVIFKDMTIPGGSYNITVDRQTVYLGEAATDPYKNGTTNPKSGYIFIGWDKDFSNVTENMVINALYEKAKYTFTAEAGKGGTATPSVQTVEFGSDAQVTITPDDGYRIESVILDGEAFDRTALIPDSGSFVLALGYITSDHAVKAEFTKLDDIQLIMEKTFNVDDDITFTAVGSWIDDTTLLEGDVKYVPDNWHHDFPKGDWGGIDDPTYSYAGKFNQPAGKYTIHVIFNKFIYKNGAWTADGTKELTNTYIVKGNLLGGTDDTPKTGDDFNPVLWISIGSVCLIALVVLGILMIKKRRSEN